MTTIEMMQTINVEIAPHKMTTEEAYEWLLDLKSLIDDELGALDSEIDKELKATRSKNE